MFSNISEIKITCDNETIIKRVDTLQFVYKAHCGCSLVTGNFYVPFYSLFCEGDVTKDVEVRHVINLPYLTEFFHFDIIVRIGYLTESINSRNVARITYFFHRLRMSMNYSYNKMNHLIWK